MPEGLLILLIVIAVTAVIAIVAFIIYRILRPRLKEEKPSDEEILKDELSRVLQDVEDEQAAEEIAKYAEKAKRSGMMSAEDFRANIEASKIIHEMSQAIERDNPINGEDVFNLIKQIFDAQNTSLKKKADDIKKYIDNSLVFCNDAFGSGQEMVLLVTEMTADASCAHFLSRYGSDQYYKYNKELLISERQIELLEEIEKLDLD